MGWGGEDVRVCTVRVCGMGWGGCESVYMRVCGVGWGGEDVRVCA